MASILLFLLHGGVIALLIIAAVQDAKKQLVSNWISIGIFVLALLAMLAGQQHDLLGLVPGLIMAAIYLIGFEDHFRGADIKLLAALGLYLGLHSCLLMLFIAAITALIYEGCRYLVTHEKRTHIPFCTWMGIAGSFILAVQMI